MRPGKRDAALQGSKLNDKFKNAAVNREFWAKLRSSGGIRAGM
jgi:hypothetical protein